MNRLRSVILAGLAVFVVGLILFFHLASKEGAKIRVRYGDMTAALFPSPLFMVTVLESAPFIFSSCALLRQSDQVPKSSLLGRRQPCGRTQTGICAVSGPLGTLLR